MVKLGIVGLGNRGTSMTRLLTHFKNVTIVAVCDSYQDRAKKGSEFLSKGYENNYFTDYHDMLSVAEIEAVMVFCAWEDHIKIAIDAMKAGKDVGVEVAGAYSVQDCFDLVACAEETGRKCMMLENCCYGRYEMMVAKLVEEGKFGTVVHCAGGYHHDLRDEIAGGNINRHYRLRNYLSRNRENYPTHELGPIAQILHINRGNRFLSLTSTASKSCGMTEFVHGKKQYADLQNETFKQGDIVTTVLTCENGETVALTLDTTLPRFYSRAFTVQGTKGLYQEDGNILYFEDAKIPKKHYLPEAFFYNSGKRALHKNDHPVWKDYRCHRKLGGHGGMDYLVLKDFLRCLEEKLPFPIDVYDMATWMVVSALSETSIAQGGAPQAFPDFTHGLWKNR